MSERLVAPQREESRWPAVFAILFVLVLLELLPGRIRVMPPWFAYAATFLLVAPMIGIAFTRGALFNRIERIVIYALVIILIVMMILGLERLIYTIFSPTPIMGGTHLLASAIEIWIVNVITFGLLYWQIDRGGPDARASGHANLPDLMFPELPAETDRIYTFADYLFFAYTTSTAFSPTETFPRTRRAKILMMVQSTISIITIIVVASRAINILK